MYFNIALSQILGVGFKLPKLSFGYTPAACCVVITTRVIQPVFQSDNARFDTLYSMITIKHCSALSFSITLALNVAISEVYGNKHSAQRINFYWVFIFFLNLFILFNVFCVSLLLTNKYFHKICMASTGCSVNQRWKLTTVKHVIKLNKF